jgi:ribosomal protein L11 methyltransferase
LPAHYLAVTFDAPGDTAETWTDALLAAGALSVDAADANSETAERRAVQVDVETNPWPVVRLTALFTDAAAAQRGLARACASVGGPLPVHSTISIPDTDWVRETQAQFGPIQVTKRLWIVPSWCEAPDPEAIVVTIDPGLAFGSGAHPSTLLCLRWLAKHLEPGASVLDYGCGSGILAIAAAKLGASHVTGVDIDPQAIATSRANAESNRVTIAFGEPDELAHQTVDVAIANILANPLEILAPLLAGRVRTGGHAILSGILETQAPAVLAAYERWFNMGPWGSTEGWVVLAGVRKAC